MSIMKTAIFIALAATIMSTQARAQRFGHGNFGGGGARPAPAFHPAPAPQRVEARPVTPPPERINGGAQRVVTHDYNRSVYPNAHPVNVHPTAVDVHGRVAVDSHIGGNVYHTGSYHGIHPYYYHPYRPFYWGPRWHPYGFWLNTLAANAFYFSLANQAYYYDDGCYYIPYNGGYQVVAPPIGAVVAYLPEGYETTQVGDQTYYYYGGAFYVYNGTGYQVVQAPPGAVVTELPDGAQQQDLDGQSYLVFNNTWFQPISQDGQDAYEIVPPPGN